MSILHKYLLKNIAQLYLAIFFILSLIIVGNQAIRFLIKGQETGIDDLGYFIALNSLKFIPTLLSLALFLSIIVGLARLYQNSEMIVLRSFGVNNRLLFLWIQPLVLLVSALIFVLVVWVNPWASLSIKSIQHSIDSMSGIANITPNTFYQFKSNSIVLHAEKVNLNVLETVFLRFNQAGQSAVVLSGSATIDRDTQPGSTLLILHNGTLYQGLFKQNGISVDQNITTFSRYKILLENTPKLSLADFRKNTLQNDVRSQSFMQLLQPLNFEQQLEIYKRLSQPLALILLSFLAIMLARGTHRNTGMMSKILWGIFVFVLYQNLLSIAKKSMLEGGMHIMWVHFLMLLLIVWFYKRQAKVLS